MSTFEANRGRRQAVNELISLMDNNPYWMGEWVKAIPVDYLTRTPIIGPNLVYFYNHYAIKDSKAAVPPYVLTREEAESLGYYPKTDNKAIHFEVYDANHMFIKHTDAYALDQLVSKGEYSSLLKNNISLYEDLNIPAAIRVFIKMFPVPIKYVDHKATLSKTLVCIKKRKYYQNDIEYLASILHELTHIVLMGKDRIVPQTVNNRFSRHVYEELVADLSSVMIIKSFGLTVTKKTSYQKEWAKEMNRNLNYLYHAVVDAQRASNVLLSKYNKTLGGYQKLFSQELSVVA